jgi:lysophospholipase L1-like esterase
MIPTRIIVFGASSVYGRNDPEFGGFTTRLRQWHEMKNRKNIVYNLGVGGNTTRDFLKRLLPECSARRPNLIVLHFYPCDIERNKQKNDEPRVPFEEFKKNAAELIKQAQSLAQVVAMSPFPNDENKSKLDATYWTMNDILSFHHASQEICKNMNVPYLNIIDEWIKWTISNFYVMMGDT